jgi:hypothetical protein
MERIEEFIGERGIARGEGISLHGIDALEGIEDPQAGRHGASIILVLAILAVLGRLKPQP